MKMWSSVRVKGAGFCAPCEALFVCLFAACSFIVVSVYVGVFNFLFFFFGFTNKPLTVNKVSPHCAKHVTSN